jgi:threonylcarbamoyladenosine tRNA methylthiotransferase MtaB
MAAVLLKSIGCRTNQEEMAALGSLLPGRGFCVVDRLEEADIVVVNTCAVTSATEAKTRRYIAGLARMRPGIRICVTGCLAQLSPLEIRRRLPATWVVGNAHKNTIPSILGDESGGVYHSDPTDPQTPLLSLVNKLPAPGELRRTRFFLKIQEGCNCRCAYCIVPLARGPSKSAAFADVRAAFARALDAGYREIVLTGTHIGQYSDRESGACADLVAALAEIPGDFRLRLSSLDPRELSGAMLDLVGNHPRVCRHLHLSVQSLSPGVLDAMDRPLRDFDAFVERLFSFRRRHPDVGLGGDFIVGFPSETEAQFEATRLAVAAVGFGYGHVFRYSRRPGTAAALMPGQIDEKEKNARSQALRETLDKCHAAFIRAVSGDIHTLLVESTGPASGLASNYLRMEVPSCTSQKNAWLRVTIAGLNPENGRCSAVPVTGPAIEERGRKA